MGDGYSLDMGLIGFIDWVEEARKFYQPLQMDRHHKQTVEKQEEKSKSYYLHREDNPGKFRRLLYYAILTTKDWRDNHPEPRYSKLGYRVDDCK